MMFALMLACSAGVLVGLSRQLNGRLSLSTSPLIASFWNHIVGFAALTGCGLVIGGLLPAAAADAPWHAYVGGPIGVVFVTAGSWVVARIGAVNSALLIIGGQMVFGVLLDSFQSAGAALWASALGVVLIMAGMVIAQGRRRMADFSPPHRIEAWRHFSTVDRLNHLKSLNGCVSFHLGATWTYPSPMMLIHGRSARHTGFKLSMAGVGAATLLQRVVWAAGTGQARRFYLLPLLHSVVSPYAPIANHLS